ncbi:MAG TPA: tripartite tricarboxylate transporter substrate binding protein [Xanthobacteraceae bacterium]|jgi:tripartite-type tricarboxylate transporter receptor subunit TctC
MGTMLRFGLRLRQAPATLLLVAGLSAGVLLQAASAQPYPNRAVRIIVPFPPGGAVDISARLMQAGLERVLGQPVIIDNRPGASGVVGTDQVAKAPADGHTLLMAFATHTVNPAVNTKLPYDTERDLAPVILIGKNPLLLLVNAKVPVRNLAEFIAYAKANDGKLNYATPGAASQAHLIIEWLSGLAGIKMQHIPYRGGAPAVMGTVAGETQLTAMSPLASLAQIEAGALRPIATGSITRDKQFPDLPTIAESGYPGFEAVAWVGMFAPVGTPREIVDRLNSEVNKLIQVPDTIAKLEQQGVTPAGGTPEAFGEFIAAEIRRWTEAARANNIRAE